MRIDPNTKEVTLTEIEYYELTNLKPGVDLEKEIQNWCKENVTGVKPIYTADSLIYDLLPKTARYFAEWGAIHLNARKEE
jgi:hypothetical protein